MDVMRLLLDSDAGTLTVKTDGALLGVAVRGGLTGDICWAVSGFASGHQGAHQLRIRRTFECAGAHAMQDRLMLTGTLMLIRGARPASPTELTRLSSLRRQQARRGP